MSISEVSIRRPVFAWMIMAALIVFGWISFKRMGISQLPDVDFPVVSISANYLGAAPEVMESDVVDVLEDAVMSIQGIKGVTSYSRQGSATITLEFDLGKSIDTAVQEVQNKVAQAQRLLPKDMDPVSINKTNPEDQPILWLAFSAENLETKEMMKYVRDVLKDQFTTVNGVGEVFLGGFVDPNLRVNISEEKLHQYSLTISDIVNTIRDEHNELPAGQIATDRLEYNVRTLGEAKSLDEFRNIIITSRGGQPNYAPISLKQIANIQEGLAEIRRISRTGGKPAVGLGIRKQRGTNAVQVADAVKKKMADINAQLPKGMKLGLNFDSTQFIKESVGEMNFTLVLSALLTAFVCWLFLGSWSSTFNVLLAIPTSIIGTFTILYFMGFTLNTFTLLGLSLAIGIVVDDAIMVLENIVRHHENGLNRFDAALIGSKEITFAAMAATVAIIAIFLPVAFMRGAIGVFFYQFGVTLSIAVAISLLEALTLTPMRCSQFISTHEKKSTIGMWSDEMIGKIENLYKKTISFSLEHPWKIIGGSALFFILSFGSVKWVNKEFMPAQDQSAFLMRIQLPVDASIEYTDTRFKEIEAYFAARSEVERYFAAIGGFGGGGEVNTGMLFVTMKPKGKRGVASELKHEATQQEFMDLVRDNFKKMKDTKVFLQDLSMRGFAASRGFPIEFTVRGADWDLLAEHTSTLMKKLEETGLVTDLDNDYKLGKPEIRIQPDRVRAAALGVSVRAISETIQASIGGVVQGKYQMGGHRYDVRVKLAEAEKSSPNDIKKLYVRNNRGELIPLTSVVKIEEKASLQQIARFDRQRAISVFSNIKQGVSQQQVLDAIQKIGKEVLPDGYKVVLSGSAASFKESFQDLMFALILGILVSYMVLASQFNSFVDPITVLIALPFSISGAFLGLLITGNSLNMYSFIGLILLMGIVKKNSILLVDFTNQIRAATPNKPVRHAILEACPIRLRPILMTSFATIAGAIPAALALGPGAETRIPMAVAVIGGVLVSTVLTLVVVPCVYLKFADLQKRVKGLQWGKKGKTSHNQQDHNDQEATAF